MKTLIAVPAMDMCHSRFAQSLATLDKVGECQVSFIMNSLIYIGSAISTYLFGLVAEWLGWGTTIFVWFCLALAGAAILALAIRPWKRFILQMEAEKQ